MYLKVKLDKDAIMPKKAHNQDAGFDLYSRDNIIIEPGKSYCFDTGVHIEIPAGLVGFLKSKSGLNCKYGIQGEGVIDAGYIGSIIVKLYNNSDNSYCFKIGDKISQLVFLPIPEITLRETQKELTSSDRGSSGFGSTGR